MVRMSLVAKKKAKNFPRGVQGDSATATSYQKQKPATRQIVSARCEAYQPGCCFPCPVPKWPTRNHCGAPSHSTNNPWNSAPPVLVDWLLHKQMESWNDETWFGILESIFDLNLIEFNYWICRKNSTTNFQKCAKEMLNTASSPRPVSFETRRTPPARALAPLRPTYHLFTNYKNGKFY